MVEGSKWLAGSVALCLPLAGAGAQTMHKVTPLAGPANMLGAAGAAARLKSQGYPEVQNLRLGVDGKWMGEVERNGVRQTITASPDGTLMTR